MHLVSSSTKVGVLDAMKSFTTSAQDAVADQLGTTIPQVESAMHDTKAEVCLHFKVTVREITNTAQYRYLRPP